MGEERGVSCFTFLTLDFCFKARDNFKLAGERSLLGEKRN